jgi:hypothetical protein
VEGETRPIPTLACKQTFWTPLRRELHRVSPLRHVLDFFTLVNLMNQFRRMIDQPHGRFTRHTGAAQAVDVGNAQAVKAQVRFLILMKNCCHRRDGWNGNSTVNFCLVLAETFKQRTQRGRHRNGKRPIFAAFGRRKCDFVLFEINAVHRQPCFPQPAASVQGNIKSSLHPFRLALSTLPESR